MSNLTGSVTLMMVLQRSNGLRRQIPRSCATSSSVCWQPSHLPTPHNSPPPSSGPLQANTNCMVFLLVLSSPLCGSCVLSQHGSGAHPLFCRLSALKDARRQPANGFSLEFLLFFAMLVYTHRCACTAPKGRRCRDIGMCLC